MRRITFLLFGLAVLAAGAAGCNSQADNAEDRAPKAHAHDDHPHDDHGSAAQEKHSHGTNDGDSHEDVSPNRKSHGHDSAQNKGHETSAELIVATRPMQVEAGKPATLKMMIHAADGSMLSDFEVVHEKKAHLIIVREGLDEFAHLHPEIDEKGNMTAQHQFPVGGTYHLFVDFKPAGLPQSTAKASLAVVGDAPQAPELEPNAPGRILGDGIDAQISVTPNDSHGAEISFELFDKGGQPVTDLRPYLGAMGHLVIVSADGRDYVHSHPLHQRGEPSIVRFEAHFPEPGIYKGWGQFQRGDRVETVPFVIDLQQH